MLVDAVGSAALDAAEIYSTMHALKQAAWLVIASLLLTACKEDGDSVNATLPASGAPPATGSPPANREPVISVKSKVEVLVGRELMLRPSASDPDGDSLSFSISNKPAWLSFSAQTGEVRGTPSAADVGSHEGIRVTVTDGKAQATASTSITVLAAANGRATVSWNAPTQRTDGTSLVDLAGFRVYYGMASGNLDQIIEIRDPGARSWVIENLTVGTWHFAATAFDTINNESVRSNTASKSIT